MFKIRTYNQISSKGLDRFPHELYEVASEFTAPDAFLLRSQKLHDEPIPDSVQAIARAGAGVNNIPVEACTRRGIVVFNSPGANANAVKELVIAGMLLGSRDIFGGMSYVQTLTDMTDAGAMAKLLEKEKKRFAGTELAGKTLGVVGLGAIGSMVANAALALGMKVAGYDPAISVESAWRLSSDVQKKDNLQSLLAVSDYVTLHVPAIEATRHLIGTESLRACRPDTRILNFAREEIVDTRAVIEALDAGALGAYITDFPVPELLGRKDVILMPHIGASTEEAEENCATMAADQLRDFLEHGNITNSVNFPATHMARTEGTRITFSNNNVPKVLGNVLAILSDRNINVIDLVNKSRNEVAYNIIDVDGSPGEDLVDAIRKVDGVVRARLISPR